MERIAIIDLGSNSIRFIIMQIGEHGAYKLIYQEKKSIRLAEGSTLRCRLLPEEQHQRASCCFPVYLCFQEGHHIKNEVGVTWAAVRSVITVVSLVSLVHMSSAID